MLRPKRGLSGPDQLASDDFKIPFSTTFGDDDWVKRLDREASPALI